MDEKERRKADEDREAARDRLSRIVKKASECRNHHDPERLARQRDSNPNAPRGVTWAELGRRFRTL